MARPEPMNASPHHAKVKLTLSFSDGLYVAGSHITGKLEMECKAEGSQGLGISLIKLDLFAVQELTSRDHSATSTFLHVTRMFQGPGLPPSNAVHPFPLPNSVSIPEGYHPSRRGTSTFLFKIPIPPSSPSSISFGNGLANIKYVLRATAGVYWKGEKRLVVSSKPIDVVDAFEVDYARDEPEGVVVGENGKIWMMAKVVGGVCVSGEQACVELQVKNHSPKKNTSISLSLTRALLLPDVGPGNKAPINITDTLTSITYKGPEYIVPSGIEGVASLVFDVPKEARVVRHARFGICDSSLGEVESIFEVRAVLEIKMGMGFGSKDLTLSMPVPILHPAALPDLAPPQVPYASPQIAYPGSSTPPYGGNMTPPYPPSSPYGYNHHPPSPSPTPYVYANIPPQSQPYVEGGQVYLPPPTTSPYPPSSYPQIPPHPSYTPHPTSYHPPPSARSGTPLPIPPMHIAMHNLPPPQETPREEILAPMPTAQPKSIIRSAAPGSIALPPPPPLSHPSAQSQARSGNTTPLHSPRPHNSVDYLTVDEGSGSGGVQGGNGSRGTRGMPRSKSVEELERVADEMTGEVDESGLIPPISSVSSPLQPQPRRNSDVTLPRRHQGGLSSSPPVLQPDVVNATIAAIPGGRRSRRNSDVQKTLPAVPSKEKVTEEKEVITLANVKPTGIDTKKAASTNYTRKERSSPAKSKTLAIPPLSSTSPTKPTNTNLLASPATSSQKIDMYKTQIGEHTKKLSKDFLASLSPSSLVKEEDKSVEELLKEQEGLGVRASGLDALEKRLMMQVGTQKVGGVVASSSGPELKKDPLGITEEEGEGEDRTPVLEAKTPMFVAVASLKEEPDVEGMTPRVPIIKPRQGAGDELEGGGDSAVSSLSLAAPISGSPGTVRGRLSNGMEDVNVGGHRRVSVESPPSSTTQDDTEKVLGGGGKKKIKVSNHRVEAWFRGLEEEGGPDPELEVLGSSRGKEGVRRKEREREKQKVTRDEETVKETEMARSSGFISFAAHAANTAKVNRSIILNRPSPASETKEDSEGRMDGAGGRDGKLAVPPVRISDMPVGSMTFHKIRAAFANSAEEERRLARAGGLMGIWAGGQAAIKKVAANSTPTTTTTSTADDKVKVAWDAEAEALAKNPWEEVLKARRQADDVGERKKVGDGGGGYDIKSARGGKGGKVTSVVQLWGDNPPSSPPPVPQEKEKRKSAPSPMIKSSSVPALLSSSTADAVLSSTASLARPVPKHRATRSLSSTANPSSGPPHHIIKLSPTSKGTNLSAIAESTSAIKSLPVAAVVPAQEQAVGRQPTSSAIGALKSTASQAANGVSGMAFGQAKLRDLIKKYQQS